MSANTRFETLFDVDRHGANVLARCRCGHAGIVEGRKLMRYWMVMQWDYRLVVIGDHLYCSRCRRRPAQLRITRQPPTGPTWGPRTDADWRRLVERLRG